MSAAPTLTKTSGSCAYASYDVKINGVRIGTVRRTHFATRYQCDMFRAWHEQSNDHVECMRRRDAVAWLVRQYEATIAGQS